MIRSSSVLFLVLAILLSAKSHALGLDARTQSWNDLNSWRLRSGPPPLRWGDSWMWIQSYSIESGSIGSNEDFALESFRTISSFHLLQKRVGEWRVSVGLPLRWAAGEGLSLFQKNAFSHSWIFGLQKWVEQPQSGWSLSYGLFVPDRFRPWYVLPNITVFFRSADGEQEAVLGFPVSSYKQQLDKSWAWAAAWRFQVDRLLRKSETTDLNYNLRYFVLQGSVQKKWGGNFYSTLKAGVNFAAEEQTLDTNWQTLSERNVNSGFKVALSLEYSFSGMPPRIR